MTNPNPVAPKTDTPATQDRSNYMLAKHNLELTEALRAAESTLAAERASRERCPECDFPYVPISNGPTAYVCAFCNLLKDNERLDVELKAERASRLQADTESTQIGEALRIAIEAFRLLKQHVIERGGFWCESGGTVDGDIYWTQAKEIVDAYAAKPSVSPEQAEETR